MTSAVSAQDSTSTATSDSARAASCAVPPGPVASSVDTIYGTLEPAGEHPLPTPYARLLLRGLIEHFRPPASLDIPAYGLPIHARRPDPKTMFSREVVPESVSAAPESVSVAMSAEIMFTLERSGHLGDARLVATSLSSALDERLLHTVTELDSTRMLPPFPTDIGANSVKVFFAMDVRPDSTRISEPMLSARMPVWVLSKPVTASRGDPTPRYPRREERDEVPGDVLISFVVDEHGTPLMDTVRLLRETDSAFGTAVLDVLPKLRFEPARIGSCPVAQHVEMPFAFRIP